MFQVAAKKLKKCVFQSGQIRMVKMTLHWYHADKQSDGSYKVHVDTASHKGDAGTYSVHLYYMLNGKRTYITETKATVPQSTESQVTGN